MRRTLVAKVRNKHEGRRVIDHPGNAREKVSLAPPRPRVWLAGLDPRQPEEETTTVQLDPETVLKAEDL